MNSFVAHTRHRRGEEGDRLRSGCHGFRVDMFRLSDRVHHVAAQRGHTSSRGPKRNCRLRARDAGAKMFPEICMAATCQCLCDFHGFHNTQHFII